MCPLSGKWYFSLKPVRFPSHSYLKKDQIKGLPWWLGSKEFCTAGDTGSIPGQEDLLEEGMAAQWGILAWRIPRTGEPGEPSPWGHKESDTTEAT